MIIVLPDIKIYQWTSPLKRGSSLNLCLVQIHAQWKLQNLSSIWHCNFECLLPWLYTYQESRCFWRLTPHIFVPCLLDHEQTLCLAHGVNQCLCRKNWFWKFGIPLTRLNLFSKTLIRRLRYVRNWPSSDLGGTILYCLLRLELRL